MTLHWGATTPKNAPALEGSSLAFLGDVIPVPGLHKIVSLGDVLIALGIVLLLALAMRHGQDDAPSAKEVTHDPTLAPFPGGAGGVRGGDARDVALHRRCAVGDQLSSRTPQ